MITNSNNPDILKEFEPVTYTFSRKTTIILTITTIAVIIINLAVIYSKSPPEGFLRYIKKTLNEYRLAIAIGSAMIYLIVSITLAGIASFIPFRSLPYLTKFLRYFLISSIISLSLLAVINIMY